MATQPRNHSRTGPDEPRDPYAHAFPEGPARDVGEALERARRHGRVAAAEGLATVRALIEAASLATTGRSSDASRLLGPLAKLLEGIGNELGGGIGAQSSRTLATVAAAIDDEIALWEKRAHDDTEARTVLRAFLGLREVLWEFGIRSGDGGPARAASQSRPVAPAPRQRKPAERSGPRVQRVPVQG